MIGRQTSRTLFRPPANHRCRPGKTTLVVTEEEAAAKNASGKGLLPVFPGTYIVDDLALRDSPAGTTIECGCGQVWVKDWVGWAHSKRSAYFVDNEWHRETCSERRRRVKRAERAGRDQ